MSLGQPWIEGGIGRFVGDVPRTTAMVVRGTDLRTERATSRLAA